VLWLHRGEVRASGPPDEVLAEYADVVHAESRARTPVGAPRDDGFLRLGENRHGSQEATIDAVWINGAPAGPAGTPTRAGGPLRLRVEVSAHDGPVDEPIVVVTLRRRSDEAPLIDVNSAAGGLFLGKEVRHADVELVIERLDLAAGDYLLDVGLYEHGWEYAYDNHHAAYPLRIDGGQGGQGSLLPPVRWTRTG
jgi:lipopolysaccharide transport system ATP-binding protein